MNSANDDTLIHGTSCQETHRSRPLNKFTRREKEFITEALTSEWDRDLRGTRVTYVEPEDADDLTIPQDDEDEDLYGVASSKEVGSQSSTPNGTRKPRINKLAKRLYPAKVIGGARAIGGAIRHPMATTRKVNNFIRRRNGDRSARNGKNAGLSSIATADLLLLKRSATMAEVRPREGPIGEGMKTS